MSIYLRSFKMFLIKTKHVHKGTRGEQPDNFHRAPNRHTVMIIVFNLRLRYFAKNGTDLANLIISLACRARLYNLSVNLIPSQRELTVIFWDLEEKNWNNLSGSNHPNTPLCFYFKIVKYINFILLSFQPCIRLLKLRRNNIKCCRLRTSQLYPVYLSPMNKWYTWPLFFSHARS